MINRFIDAQKKNYENAFDEIKNGKKLTHWMWYVFPQIHSLGRSSNAIYYALKNISECVEYLNNNYLFNNIYNICDELLKINHNDPIIIFGKTDAMKLHSSMTIFDYVYENKSDLLNRNESNIFNKIIIKYFDGKKDNQTLLIIKDDIDFRLN